MTLYHNEYNVSNPSFFTLESKDMRQKKSQTHDVKYKHTLIHLKEKTK